VIRDGKRQNVELTVGAIPDEGKDLDACPSRVSSAAAIAWAFPWLS
jgi:serine protease Do